jgi:hypothetical protein
MDFYFYKHNIKSFDDKLLKDVLSKDEITICKNNSVIKYTKNCQTNFRDDNFLLFSGRVLYDNLNVQESKERFLVDIKNLNWPLPETIHGYFSGFLETNQKTYVFTDPIGLYNLFYYIDDNCVVISSSLMAIQKTIKAPLNTAGIVLETFGHTSQFGTMTAFQGIKRLWSGELLIIENNKKKESLFDYSIKKEETIPSKNIAEELVTLINEENNLLYDGDIIVGLSGGVDSRVNLAPLIKNNKKFEAINYGKEDLIDSSIPKKIAEKFKFKIDFIDPTPNLFPKKEIITDMISKTSSAYINSWHSLLLGNKEANLFLLGDITDILRAKNISSLKGRKFRTIFYIKKFFLGKKLELNEINTSNKNEFKEIKINQLKKNLDYALVNFKVSDEEKETIKKTAVEDLTTLFNHLDNYNCKYIESYEELYGIFTWGRLAMGKQLNLLQYKYKAEIPLTNIKIARKVLNISPNYRYADELTSKMFKSKSWKKLGNFPLSQNPLVAYNSSFYLMLIGWFLRSKTDFFLTKLSVASKGKMNKKRLFKSYDYQKSYCYPGAFENFKSYFEPNEIYDYENIVNLFENRANKTAWPFSSMDLMPHVQIMYYIANSKTINDK